MMRWRIYYDSGETADDQSHQVQDVPGEGVIVIAQAHDDPRDPLRGGRQLLYDTDFYYWEDRWYKCDAYGRDDYLRRPGWRKVIAGRNTTTAQYHALIQRAYNDPALPSKSAWLPGERRVL